MKKVELFFFFYVYILTMPYISKNSFIKVQATDFPLESGKLLLAAPFMSDSYFDKTVILMVEHGKDGSLGFILNRTLHVSLNDVLKHKVKPVFQLHNGGPVELNKLFFIHTCGDLISGSESIGNGLYLGGNEHDLEPLLKEGLLDESRISFYLGYSAWSPGQLEKEMKEKAWVVAPFHKDCVFSPNEHLWRIVVGNLGDRYKHWLEIPDKAYYN